MTISATVDQLTRPVNELLTSARDNAAALDQAAEELDPESTDAIELRGAAEALLRIAAEVALELAVATEARRGPIHHRTPNLNRRMTP